MTLPYGISNFTEFRTTAGMVFADKTPYIEQLEKNPNYRYTFLRPRRFGKSTFLNMLCEYYDIRKADVFEDLFGPLYIGKNPTSSHNKYLVLKFDLSLINVIGSIDEMKMSFNKSINFVLKEFVEYYQRELRYPEVKDVIDTESASISLSSILDLASYHGHSLFVGVDEYDAPVNNSTFTGMTTGLDNAKIGKISRIEEFFNFNFFAVLKEGCGNSAISKYFLTGVTPAFYTWISPLIEAAIVSNNVNLHGICGFTGDEVKAIVQHYLSKDEKDSELILSTMRRLYNGYFFAGSGYDESNPQPPLLYNPHLVFHYINEYSTNGVVTNPEESTAVHSTAILKSISDIGEFSVKDLEDLIINGSVKSEMVTEFGFNELLTVGKDRTITWSLLYYFGILTHDPNGNLRIPNDVVKLDVLKRITTYLRAQDMIRPLIGPAIDNLVSRGRVDEFGHLLKEYLQTREARSTMSVGEDVLQGIVEVLLDKPSNRMSEFCLVVDGTKCYGDDRFGFIDIFIPPDNIFIPPADGLGLRTRGVVLELKNFTLQGLLCGEAGKWYKPFYSDLKKLRNRLDVEKDEQLLARKYIYWEKVQKKEEDPDPDPMEKEKKILIKTTVNDIMKHAKEQLDKYIKTLACGKPITIPFPGPGEWNCRYPYCKPGVMDSRIKIAKGDDVLQGHVVMAIGGRRILVHSTELISTQYEYQKALRF